MPQIHPVQECIIYALLRRPKRFSDLYEAVGDFMRKLHKRTVSKALVVYHLRQLMKRGIVARRQTEEGWGKYYLTPFRTRLKFKRDNGQVCDIIVLWFCKETPFIIIPVNGSLDGMSGEEWRRLLGRCRRALLERIAYLINERPDILSGYITDLYRELYEVSPAV